MKTKTITSLIACLVMVSCLCGEEQKFPYTEKLGGEGDKFGQELLSLNEARAIYEEEKNSDPDLVLVSEWNVYLDEDLRSNEIHFELLDSTQLTQKKSGEGEGIGTLLEEVTLLGFAVEGGRREEASALPAQMREMSDEIDTSEESPRHSSGDHLPPLPQEEQASGHSMPLPSAPLLEEHVSGRTSLAASFEEQHLHGHLIKAETKESPESDHTRESVSSMDDPRTHLKEVAKELFPKEEYKPRLTEEEFHNF